MDSDKKVDLVIKDMPDVLVKKRSELMAKIKSRNTLPERTMKRILELQGMKPEMWPDLPGHPDILIVRMKCVIFVHGCFWHGCKKHYRVPKTNAEFWREKIRRNIERHERNSRELKRMGYNVLTIWEHDL